MSLRAIDAHTKPRRGASEPGPLVSHFAPDYFGFWDFSCSGACPATCRSFVTLNTPGTPLARMFAVSLSAFESTTPYSVTRPFCTEMRIGLAGLIAYLFRLGYP